MNRRISVKLIVAVSLAITLIISVFASMLLKSQSDVLLSTVELHTLQLSDAIKNSSGYDMKQGHREHIIESIKSVAKPQCIISVRIFNKAGEVVYASDSSEVGEMVDTNAEGCYVCHAANEPLKKLTTSDKTRIFQMYPDSAHVMGVINPIDNEPSCWKADCHAHTSEETILGVLDIVVCLKTYEQSMRQAKNQMIFLAIIAILALSILIWFFVRSLIDKPVKNLVEATKTVASGNLHHLIANTGRNDELGALARSFNNMTQKLSDARTQLFQSDKMASLGQLAAGVAHEINNPLTGILTYSSFLLKRTQRNPELQKDLAIIVNETKRSREIVKGLLDFSRQSSPKKNCADINEIIERAIGVINNQLSLNNIKLVLDYNEQLPKAEVDSNQLQQVFINLINNAAYALNGGTGTITIKTEKKQVGPYGITQIKRAICPKGHSLIDTSIKLDGMPSIKLKSSYKGSEGFINLHPVYGNTSNQYGLDLKKDSELIFACCSCNTSLMKKNSKCPKCGAPIYQMQTPPEGSFEGCTRKGCDWQQWQVVDDGGLKDFILIIISDTGKGISPQDLNKIFDPFFSTKGQEGTGLGLAVSWGIINNHNGSIKVASKLGEGSTFTIMLPVSS